MVLGQIGPLTAAIEAMATAVGAGIVLGSFTMGTVGLALGRPRHEIEGRALTDGYVGGAVAVAVALMDMLIRYCLK